MKEKYLPSNTVRCLAIYEWQSKIDILGMRGLFERFNAIVGSYPDDVWICPPGTWKGKDYKYRNFIRRNIIEQHTWNTIVYHWRRQPDARLYFAMNFAAALHDGSEFSVMIDEAAVADVDLMYEEILKVAATALLPIYGMGFSVPYSWSPGQFISGNGSGYQGPDEGLHYDTAEAFSVRGREAGSVLVAEPRVLDHKLRDIFDINLISAKHLRHEIEGKSLKAWIEGGRHGSLIQMNDVTWRWDLPPSEQPKVRKAAITAELIADPFWTKLSWIDE